MKNRIWLMLPGSMLLSYAVKSLGGGTLTVFGVYVGIFLMIISLKD